MSHATDLKTLARWLSADFSNQAQAFENPPFYAHIRVAIRPAPQFQEPMLFLEQAYDFMLQRPYRLRVLKLKVAGDHIEIENFKVQNEEKFYGAARDLNKLKTLTLEDLAPMNGCDMIVTWSGHSFQGVVEPGKNCVIVRDGKETYLDNSFEVSEGGLVSLDRGYDPQTDELVWGSVAGAFHFQRRVSFADEVNFS
ncbi:MAG: chorismate-binding protein [Cyanobacteria bacterium RI_101]|nr:chorismate-binding protein [Cyanobacteria bacterium RI_101]